MSFLFLGERRSNKAIQMGVTWENGNLAARPLFNALSWHGIDPAGQRFENLFLDGAGAFLIRPDAQRLLTEAAGRGETVVAMGNRVATALTQFGVEHVKIVHPAARGAIRLTERYVKHIGERLLDRL